MPAIFISHSSWDKDAARTIHARLKARGFHGIFLDYHPEDGIPAGRNWEQELYRQLRQCTAVVFLSSEHSTLSQWCFAELALAISMGKPIFPLKLRGDARHLLLENVQWTDLAAEGEAAYERLWRGLQDHGIDPRDIFAWDPRRSPYPGLVSFEEQDSAVFFGRLDETQALFERVNNGLLGSGEWFVAVIGPSGSGKSSLVRAGLIPKLKCPGSPWLVVRPFIPQEDPLEMLVRSLALGLGGSERRFDWHTLYDQMARNPRSLSQYVRDLLDSDEEQHRAVLLVVDQAEELVTRSRQEARTSFVRVINEGLEAIDALRVVITLCSEFLTSL